MYSFRPCISRLLRYTFVCSLLALLIAGCASGGKTGASSKSVSEYPESRYMTATGLGQSESEARNQAVAELSRIFESRVSSETLDRVRLIARGTGDEFSEQRLDSQVKVISRVELKGVEVPKTWQEKGTHYAMAVLDRQKAGENWLREIENLDSKVRGRLEALGSISSRLLRYKRLTAVSAIWIEREVLVSRLRVLGFRDSTSPGYDMQAIFREIAATKAAMPLYVSISGEYGSLVKKGLSEALGRSGFVLASTRKNADVVVEGQIDIQPVDVKNPELSYARARVSLAVKDAQGNLSVGEVTEDRRGAHLSYSEAVNRALKKVIAPISEKLMELLHVEND